MKVKVIGQRSRSQCQKKKKQTYFQGFSRSCKSENSPDEVQACKLQVCEPIFASCKSESHWQVCSLQCQVASYNL